MLRPRVESINDSPPRGVVGGAIAEAAEASAPLVGGRHEDVSEADCRSYVTLVFAVVSATLTSGLVFGFVALRHVMVAEGVYAHLCDGDANGCDSQQLRLDWVFIVAAFVTNAGALPVGWLLDAHGARATCLVGALLLAAGCALFGASSASLDGFIPAYALLAAGGACVLLAMLQLANRFPRARSDVLYGVLGGAFGLSAGVFFVFQLTGAALRDLFFAYIAVPAVVGVGAVFAFPAQRSATDSNASPSGSPTHARVVISSAAAVGNNGGTRATSGLPAISNLRAANAYDSTASTDSFNAAPATDIRPAAAANGLPVLKVDGPRGGSSALRYADRRLSLAVVGGARQQRERQSVTDVNIYKRDELSVRETFATAEFIALVLVLSVWLLRVNFYITTAHGQLNSLAGSGSSSSGATDVDGDASQSMANVLSGALALGGFVAVFGAGVVIRSTGTIAAWAALCAVGILFGATNLIPSLGAQYATIVLFVVFRPFLYCTASHFTAQMFGADKFGKIYGTALFVAAVVSLVLQIGLDYAARNHSFTVVNAVLLAVSVPTLLFPAYLRRETLATQLYAVAGRLQVVGAQIQALASQPAIPPPPMSPMVGGGSASRYGTSRRGSTSSLTASPSSALAPPSPSATAAAPRSSGYGGGSGDASASAAGAVALSSSLRVPSADTPLLPRT